MELVPLTAHGLHQNRQMELPAPAHLVDIWLVRVHDRERDIFLQFPEKPLSELPRGYVFPRLSREGGVVDVEVHRQRGLFHLDAAYPFAVIRVGERHADLDPLEPCEGHDVPCVGGFHIDPFEAQVGEQLHHLGFLG